MAKAKKVPRVKKAPRVRQIKPRKKAGRVVTAAAARKQGMRPGQNQDFGVEWFPNE